MARGRPFKPGDPRINRNGPAKGTKQKRTILRQQIEACGPELIARIKAIAFNEEDSNAVTALLALLARLEAPLRPVTPPTPFNFNRKGNHAEMIEDVLAAMASGDLSADIGEKLITSIGTLVNARKVEELEALVKQLVERRL